MCTSHNNTHKHKHFLSGSLHRNDGLVSVSLERLMKCTIFMLLSLYTNRQPRRIEFALRLTAFKYRISYKFLRAAAAVFSLCYCFKCNKIPFYFVCHKTCSVRARSIENMLWLGEKAPLLWCSFTQLIHKPNRCRIPFHSIDLCGVFLSVTQEIHLINRKKVPNQLHLVITIFMLAWKQLWWKLMVNKLNSAGGFISLLIVYFD